MIIISKSEKQTLRAAKKLARGFVGGETVLLSGELGAGKTVFTKGLAVGLGVKGCVTSPTFALMNEYALKRLSLVHIDAYRLSGGAEARGAGITERFGQEDTVTVIEWAGNIASEIPTKNVVKVDIEKLSESERKITVEVIT